MARYDAAVIYEYADALYNQADQAIMLATIGGVLVGGVLGSVIDWWAAILGALVLGTIGYLVGQSRASQLKLSAQLALCQVQIEENTRQPGGARTASPGVSPLQTAPANSGFRWDAPSTSRYTPTSSSPSSIDDQEKQFLSLFAQELSLSEIAGRLRISDDQVTKLLIQVRQKLGAHTTTEMIQKAKERGYV